VSFPHPTSDSDVPINRTVSNLIGALIGWHQRKAMLPGAA
jgi:hypothetical protein